MKRSTRLQRPGLLGGSTATTLLDADGPQPSLNLDLASGILDPRITFTRSTVGTYYRGQFNQNLLVRSQEFDNTSAWQTTITGTGVAPIRVANNAVAPDGTMTADTITFNSGAGTTASDRSDFLQSFTATNATYTFSVWIRGTLGGEKLTIRHVGNGAYTTVTASTEWQRFTVTETGSVGLLFIGIRQSVPNVINSTATVELWGAQMTEGSLLTPYIPTTTAAITQGQIASAAINVPRFENDPVTGEARGLLIEGGATNLQPGSADPASANWSKTNCTVGTAITAPDGTATGFPITVTTTGVATSFRTGTITVSATSVTGSCFIKKNVNDTVAFNVFDTTASTLIGTATFTFSTQSLSVSGVTATATNVGNGWYRIAVTATWTSGNGLRFFIGYTGGTSYTAGDSFYFWGGQVEAQAFASSYIPTVAATVARGADSAVMTGTNFSSWYNQSEGTVYASVYSPTTTPAAGYGLNDNTLDNRMNFGLASGTLASNFVVVTSTASQASLLVSGTPTIRNTAFAYKVDDFAAVVNGSTPATDLVGTVPTVTQLQIGGNTTFRWNNNIRRIAYWPTRLPDATLQSLTT